MIYKSLTDIIGHTPLLEISGLPGQKARLLAKLEAFNPGGSVKDRAALRMIEDAENRGVLTPGATIIEPTSGNTGVGLAWIGAVKGYRVVITMPETMSQERRNLLKAYGAILELTPGAEGMAGAIRRAEELKATIPGSVILGQFTNPANPQAHEQTTGPEIWKDSEGAVDVFVAGVGTGGTICGTGRYLKSRKSSVEVVAVEPASSAVLSGGKAGAHGLQGIGAGFVPEIYDAKVVDRVIPVTEDQAFAALRMLSRRVGYLAGISSGAAFHAATLLACEPQYEGKTIVVLLPDTGERYLSTFLEYEKSSACNAGR